MASQSVVIGGGCFWCVEAVFQRINGITKLESGYAGGYKVNPTYRDVCLGITGHAEVVRVEFDDQLTSVSQIFDLFFKAHDPTTLNRQGADEGSQYRSIILYADEDQRLEAEAAIKRAEPRYNQPIVTEIKKLDQFYKAELHHQNYYNRNQSAGYCQYVIAPKLTKLGLA